MAPASKDELVRLVYDALQAASCPLVEGLYLQDTDSMLQLLCTPSQHRTDILLWICSSINQNFDTSKSMAKRCKDSDVVTKEMALLGQELMLCKAGDLDLIRGEVSPYRQLQFLEELLTLVPGCRKSAGHKMDAEMLLNEVFSAENLPHLSQMLEPTFNPWPAHIKALQKGPKSSHKPSREDAADVAALLQETQSALEQLQSECDFLKEAQSPDVFSPSSLRVAACDLQQLMATFSHVYETDLRAYCSRDPPSLSTETTVFQRVHQLLLDCNTELDMLNEVSEASASISEEVNVLQTQPRYWRRGEKHSLPDQLAELTRRSKDFLSLMATTSDHHHK
ncbi:HAUS augmin-like complex subunit 7 [Limanda limanda]|uniref:HAUS augmin-like complex subunit 7 n=1 Tax=Limanda limanda TaxID=27771 RepID=UPI0029C939E4|nr:HAUS augmin-like complex subunit 7 [Limanda limanda]